MPHAQPLLLISGRIILGDRLEALAQKGFIQAAGLGGRYAPGMTLSNGIHNVRLTEEGRQLLRGQQ